MTKNGSETRIKFNITKIQFRWSDAAINFTTLFPSAMITKNKTTVYNFVIFILIQLWIAKIFSPTSTFRKKYDLLNLR
jgi:hypothetical protein